EYIKPGSWGTETVKLSEAYGRVLAEDVFAKVSYPPFDRSTVDGYAVRSTDLAYASEVTPVKLKIVGSIKVGEWSQIEVKSGEAVEIDTGASLPRGADSVVMIEHTKKVGDEVLVFRNVAPGENVAKVDSDIAVGDLVLRKCTRLGEREIAVLAAAGYSSVLVFKKPKVAVVSTGVEIVEPGSDLSLGKVYDINSYSIAAGLFEIGAEPVVFGIVKDELEALVSALKRAVESTDMIVVTGGTSAGPTDITYRAVESLGFVRVLAHGLLVKPGKPTLIAITDSGKLIFGLPGHPGAALTMFNLIVKPAIKRGLCLDEEQPVVRARLARRVEGARGRKALIPVSLVKKSEEDVIAYPILAWSGAVRALTLAEGFITVGEDLEYLEEGETVDVFLYSPSYKPADLYVVGSHDIALDITIIPRLNFKVKALYVGSLGGIDAAVREDSDVSGIHLLDIETGEYNVPELEKREVKGLVLVRGYQREQGIVLPKGNPHRVSSFEDIVIKRLRIVNRSKGSGTRTLIDYLLKKVAEKLSISFTELAKRVEGYTHEVSTHTAVAALIAQGKADAGVATRIAAELYGLDFLSLGWEQFDFLIPKSKLNKRAVKKFLEAIAELKDEISRLPGYRVPKDYATVIWER
ncbi:MAG: molybdopterin biosynthesis protein, partial [Acidilobaceae archaeon]